MIHRAGRTATAMASLLTAPPPIGNDGFPGRAIGNLLPNLGDEDANRRRGG